MTFSKFLQTLTTGKPVEFDADGTPPWWEPDKVYETDEANHTLPPFSVRLFAAHPRWP